MSERAEQPRLLVLGTPDDVRGFALAGIAGVAPANGRDVEQWLAATAGLELVFVSSEVAALAPRAVVAAMARASGPVISILPQASEPSRRGGVHADVGERGGAERRGA